LIPGVSLAPLDEEVVGRRSEGTNELQNRH
jgi:hypothetical protein